jgi:dienelactone hydrolase
MNSLARRLLMSIGFVWLAAGSLPAAAQVEALFDLRGIAGGPFPTNVFTRVELANRSNRAVQLPRPDCAAMPARCAEIDTLNTLDGFNLQPRVRIPFSGAIDVSTVNSGTFFLLNLGDTDSARDRRRGEIVGVNQIVFDPETNTLTAESGALLRQHTRYALIATNGIKDTMGRPVRGTALGQFLRNRQAARDAGLEGYRTQLQVALARLRGFGISANRVVSASVFTTQSNTAILEKMRAEVQATTPPPSATFFTGTNGELALFPVGLLQSVTFQRQVGTEPRFGNQTVQIAAFGLIPGSVGAIAFGSYPSPTFLNAGRVIPAVGTRSGRPAIQGTRTISFFLVLPAGQRPEAGWPVALFGHGFGGDNNSIIAVASVLASQGIATAAINVVGHGGGPAGTLTIARTDRSQVVVPSGGRGQDLNGDGDIDGTEGFSAGGLIGSRDTLRQTVADLMQLVRTFRSGVDVDLDGLGDFDPDRIFYTGISLGGIYGTMLLGVEPNVRAGAPNVPGGVLTEIARLSQAFRGQIALAFGALGLLNAPPIAPPLFGFNENIPLRNLPPIVNDVPGASRLAEAIDNLEWVAVAGDPLGYARHVRAEPLAGNSPKPLIFQFARGDMTVPNPTSSALVRAGEFQDRVTFFRNDIFVQQQQQAGASVQTLNALRNPHGFLGSIVGLRAQTTIAAQMQIAMFFASNGALTIDPDGPGPLFETPVALPEDLGFLPQFTTATPVTVQVPLE